MSRPESDALWLVDEGIFQQSNDESSRASLAKRGRRLALPAIAWGARARWVLACLQIDAGAPRVAAVLGVFSDAPVTRWKTLSGKPSHEGSACLVDEATLQILRKDGAPDLEAKKVHEDAIFGSFGAGGLLWCQAGDGDGGFTIRVGLDDTGACLCVLLDAGMDLATHAAKTREAASSAQVASDTAPADEALLARTDVLTLPESFRALLAADFGRTERIEPTFRMGAESFLAHGGAEVPRELFLAVSGLHAAFGQQWRAEHGDRFEAEMDALWIASISAKGDESNALKRAMALARQNCPSHPFAFTFGVNGCNDDIPRRELLRALPVDVPLLWARMGFLAAGAAHEPKAWHHGRGLWLTALVLDGRSPHRPGDYEDGPGAPDARLLETVLVALGYRASFLLEGALHASLDNWLWPLAFAELANAADYAVEHADVIRTALQSKEIKRQRFVMELMRCVGVSPAQIGVPIEQLTQDERKTVSSKAAEWRDTVERVGTFQPF